MRKLSRALSFVMTLAMLLSGIAAAEQQYFNNGGGGEFVDPHTFTKPYAVNEVIVPADEATGQVALEADEITAFLKRSQKLVAMAVEKE